MTPTDYAVFSDKNEAMAAAGNTATNEQLEKLKKTIARASVVVFACNRDLKDMFIVPLYKMNLDLGQWSIHRPKSAPPVMICRAPSHTHMNIAWDARPRRDAEMRLGKWAVMRRLCVAVPMTLKIGAVTVYFAVPRPEVALTEYTGIAKRVIIAGYTGAVETKIAQHVNVMRMPFLRMGGDYPMDIAHAWDTVLRDVKETTIIVAPAFFLADVLRYMHALRVPQSAAALTANAFGAAFDDTARQTDLPTLRPRALPVDATMSVR